jgi:cell division protein FtsN
VKPANLVLARLPDRREVVKVLDFGISKTVLTLSPKLTAKGQLMGTPFYMSPEQLLSASDVDQRTDIWSLGVIVHELLTGHRPFTGETLTELIAAILEDEPPAARAARSDVPEQLDALIGRCLAKDPTQRPADLGEFVEALGAFGTERHRQAAERIRATLRFAGGDPSSMQKRPDDGEVERPSGEASTVEDEGRQSSARPAAGEPDAAQSTLGSAHWSNARERAAGIRQSGMSRVALLVGAACTVAAVLYVSTHARDEPSPASGAQEVLATEPGMAVERSAAFAPEAGVTAAQDAGDASVRDSDASVNLPRPARPRSRPDPD